MVRYNPNTRPTQAAAARKLSREPATGASRQVNQRDPPWMPEMGRSFPQGLNNSRKGAGRNRYHRNKAAQGLSTGGESRWHHEKSPLVLQGEGIIV